MKMIKGYNGYIQMDKPLFRRLNVTYNVNDSSICEESYLLGCFPWVEVSNELGSTELDLKKSRSRKFRVDRDTKN